MGSGGIWGSGGGGGGEKLARIWALSPLSLKFTGKENIPSMCA